MPSEPNDAAGSGAKAAGGSLRMSLRASTREQHELTEQAFEAFDVATSAGLRRFLLAHRTALETARGRTAHDANAAQEIGFMLDLIRADLASLGDSTVLPIKFSDSAPLHPLGVRYVLLGSRLGSQILAQRVSGGPEKNLQSAGTYVSDRTLLPAWKSLLQTLEGAEAAAQEGDIRMSAAETFKLFRDAAEKVRQAVL
jgi:heme oxygenase (biliverdin-IX-beta and delta-forming)